MESGPKDNKRGLQAERSARANARLMERVEALDARGVFRSLEEGSGDWLEGSECQSDDPLVNPALRALLDSSGPECVEAFDDFFGDLRSWSFGRWSPLHWAVAQKSQWALRWCLSGPRDQRISLLKEEAPDENGLGRGPRRSALALCAQMGDPKWLAKVLDFAEKEGQSPAQLAKRDAMSSPTALGSALFELANKSRDGAPKQALDSALECVEYLSRLGFSPDSHGVSAGKLCVALALSEPGHKGNAAMGPVAALAVKLGSGSGHGGHPLGPFDAAGLALDPDWERALRLCGLDESPLDCFAFGVGKRLAEELGEEGSNLEWARNSARVASIGALLRSALSARPDLDAWPIRGLELECLGHLSALAKGSALHERSAASFREKVELALSSARGHAPKKSKRI